MPVTQPQILEAIEATIRSAPDTGLTLTRERNIESAAELINLFRALNEGRLHGWLVRNLGFSQIREGGSCDITRSIRYGLEALYPFEDKPFSGLDSHGKFRQMVESVNDAFNDEANWGLGLEGENYIIEHQLLQAADDYQVMLLGEGADSHLIHYGSFELMVNLGITV